MFSIFLLKSIQLFVQKLYLWYLLIILSARKVKKKKFNFILKFKS